MSTPATARTHDVNFRTSAQGFYVRNDNGGLTLHDDNIVWSVDGKPDGAPYKNIAAIELRSGGWGGVPYQCRIRFKDGLMLLVVNTDANGRPDDGAAARYRSFVHDLHDRLAARSDVSTYYSAGLPEGGHMLMLICTALLGLIFVVGPIIGFIITRDLRSFLLMIFAPLFYWPLTTMVRKNAPQSYTPDRVPNDVLG